jgi:hypothetical protein
MPSVRLGSVRCTVGSWADRFSEKEGEAPSGPKKALNQIAAIAAAANNHSTDSRPLSCTDSGPSLQTQMLESFPLAFGSQFSRTPPFQVSLTAATAAARAQPTGQPPNKSKPANSQTGTEPGAEGVQYDSGLAKYRFVVVGVPCIDRSNCELFDFIRPLFLCVLSRIFVSLFGFRC